MSTIKSLVVITFLNWSGTTGLGHSPNVTLEHGNSVCIIIKYYYMLCDHTMRRFSPLYLQVQNKQ